VSDSIGSRLPAPGSRLPASGSRLPAPGFINAHTHIYSGLAPFGLPAPEPPPENFVQILERVWWRLDRALDERALHASARWYVADALAHGTVALVDHHESPNCIAGSLDILADACQELGMPALLCYGATERNEGREEARRGLAECRRFIERNTRPLVRGVVGLHASFTVSDETVREAGALCRDLGTVLHVHLAEDRADVEDAGRRGWPGPLERLLELDALPPGSILAHGVHLSAGQVGDAERQGCWLVQNPRSNRGNRVGYPGALRESARVALGTDGYGSDPAAERAALLDEARLHGDDLATVARREDAGHALLAERFGEELPAARAGHVDIEALRADAEEEARRLWSRMAEL
jgi:cytosine/adenosine deaminase-related metal-dependent hydrolase